MSEPDAIEEMYNTLRELEVRALAARHAQQHRVYELLQAAVAWQRFQDEPLGPWPDDAGRQEGHLVYERLVAAGRAIAPSDLVAYEPDEA